jgi:hypothetical protein
MTLLEQLVEADKDRDDQILKTKITMEISRIKKISISIIRALERKMPRIFGRKQEGNIRRALSKMPTATSTKPVRTLNQNSVKKQIEQMQQETPKKKLNGEVAIHRKRKTFTKRISTAICSGLRMASTPKRGGKAILHQTLTTLNSSTLIQFSTNSSLVEKSKKKKRHMTNILQDKIPTLIRKIGDFRQDQIIFKAILGHLLFGLEF